MFLEKILKRKRTNMIKAKNILPVEVLKKGITGQAPAVNFKKALFDKRGRALIAEIKRASPSKGLILMEEEPGKRALLYEKNGAAAVSVLTEEDYFLGRLEDLRGVKSQVKIPVLRKDFIIDEYQIYESRYYGADAVLFITSILTDEKLVEFIKLARSLTLFSLVEVHNGKEMQRAISCGADIIGINNRNLNTFRTDLNITLKLSPRCPPGVLLVSESGIKSQEDLEILRTGGVHAFLVGEALMNHPLPGNKIKELLGYG